MEPEGSLTCSNGPTARSYAVYTHIPYSLRSILTLSYHPHLGLGSGLYSSGFLTKTLYAFLASPIHDTRSDRSHSSVSSVS